MDEDSADSYTDVDDAAEDLRVAHGEEGEHGWWLAAVAVGGFGLEVGGRFAFLQGIYFLKFDLGAMRGLCPGGETEDKISCRSFYPS